MSRKRLTYRWIIDEVHLLLLFQVGKLEEVGGGWKSRSEEVGGVWKSRSEEVVGGWKSRSEVFRVSFFTEIDF